MLFFAFSDHLFDFGSIFLKVIVAVKLFIAIKWPLIVIALFVIFSLFRYIIFLHSRDI